MSNPALALITKRISTNAFDPEHSLSPEEIEALASLATRAPTAFNLQNWRFIALRTPAAKARIWNLVQQEKVMNAAVTFIVCGQLPAHGQLVPRLLPFVTAGHMSESMAAGWQAGANAMYADPQMARDEAIRSATMGAATLIYAAQALGLASSAMLGFEAGAVVREFALADDEIPVMLVAVGRSAPGNWPQKPRRPLAEVLELQ